MTKASRDGIGMRGVLARVRFMAGSFLARRAWIVFQATRPNRVEATIFATAVSGGQWIPISDGKQWDDKPRWSPDGKTIYFVSRRHGFYNVFGIIFDSAKGQPVGSPFPVTKFNNPSAMIPREIMGVEIGISQDRLVVNVEQLPGSIWVLDHADR